MRWIMLLWVTMASSFFLKLSAAHLRSAKYPTTMCGMDKVLYAWQVYQHFGVKSFLFVQWTDELAYISMNNDCTLAIGGRAERNDPQDTGVYALFAVDEFKGL